MDGTEESCKEILDYVICAYGFVICVFIYIYICVCVCVFVGKL